MVIAPLYAKSHLSAIGNPRSNAAGARGSVLLHAVVRKDGKPLQQQVWNSQVNPDVVRAAVEAVSQWRYQPTLLNGEPVEIDTTIQVKFSLLP